MSTINRDDNSFAWSLICVGIFIGLLGGLGLSSCHSSVVYISAFKDGYADGACRERGGRLIDGICSFVSPLDKEENNK